MGFGYRTVGVTCTLALWQGITAPGWVDPTLLPSPAQVFATFIELLRHGEYILSLVNTLRDVITSFVVGGVLGVTVGLIVGGVRSIEFLVGPYLYSVYSLPKIAIIPLFVVWLGVGSKTIIIVSSIAVGLLVAINTIEGVKSVDPILLRAALNLGATRRQIFAKVLLPGASGLILSGLKLGIGQALITVTAGEIVLSGAGVGALMWDAQQSLRTDIVFVCLFTLAVIGIVSVWFLELAERSLFPWRASEMERGLPQ